VALPYVRNKYKAQFSALQSATFLLLLHLSFADILYGVLGYPHFIHSLVVGGENPFQFPGGDNLCWTLAMLRNWAAEADFTTMGAIAFMACRQMVCKKCEEKKDFSNHQEHDGMYSRRGVMVVIILVWVWSLAFILPDCLRLTGGYRWSNTTYGCDNVYYEVGEKSYGMIINVVINILVIFISYSIVSWKLRKGRWQEEEMFKSSENTTQHIKMLLRLAITYTICVIPASFFCWGIFDIEWFPKDKKLYKQIFQTSWNCLYWSMYCINFLLYLVPNSEIRRGFIVFFRDVKKRCSASLKRGIDKIKINKSLSPEAPDMHGKKSSPGSLDMSGENSSPGSLDMPGENSSLGSLDMSGENSSPGSLDMTGENSSLRSLGMSKENSSLECHDMLGKNCSLEGKNRKNRLKTRKVTLVSTDSDIIYISTRL